MGEARSSTFRVHATGVNVNRRETSAVCSMMIDCVQQNLATKQTTRPNGAIADILHDLCDAVRRRAASI